MSTHNSQFVKNKIKGLNNHIHHRAALTPEQWLMKFMAIYEQSAPLIQAVTKPCLKGQSVNNRSLIEAHRRFPPLLSALKEMPVTPLPKLQDIKNILEIILTMCIKAGAFAMKMADETAYGSNTISKKYNDKVVRYTNYAALQHASLLEKLNNIKQYDEFNSRSI